MIPPKFDLHTHTTASDGVLTPEQLYIQAKMAGVEVLAITDHDTVEGVKWLLERYKSEIAADGPRIIVGAEFTCLLGKQVLHIVGLGLDMQNPILQRHMEKLDNLRLERAERIALKLEKKKLPNVFELVKEKAGKAQIGRPHFAKVLCDLKIVSSEDQAFKKYLGAGKIANVAVAWPELEEVLDIIKQSGAVSVLAHPTKYNLTMSKLRRVIAEFKILGGDAVEISYPGVNREQQNILKYEIEKHELLISAGSDFHTPMNPWTKLGLYPEIPANLSTVLSSGLLADN